MYVLGYLHSGDRNNDEMCGRTEIKQMFLMETLCGKAKHSEKRG